MDNELGIKLSNNSRIPEGIKRIMEEGQLYLYGNSKRAQEIMDTTVRAFNIHISGVIVSKEYFNGDMELWGA